LHNKLDTAAGAGDAAASPSKSFFGGWANLAKIKAKLGQK